MAVDTKSLLDDAQKAEAEAHIRSNARICRGPLREGYSERIVKLLDEGDRPGASALDHEGRVDPDTTANVCGKDFNDVVVSGPWDGRPHEYACKCGVKGTYVAPKFAPKEG